MTIALYAGSFDPITNGHLHVVEAAAGMFDQLVLAVGIHHSKAPMLSVEERLALVENVCGPVASEKGCSLQVVTFDDLVIDAACRAGAQVLVRGLRSGTDFDYEMQMAGMNASMAPGVQSVFIPASADTRPITATLVRQIASMGGDISPFVPRAVAETLAARFPRSSKG
ncbi:pantetheine-phosphate adenylyltransferase [Terrihabitans sp. B22-R8]|uniref:pantetheine-phosphate adenylyltransferase n=1 Tax=Terrihabitans sp. B22-R8 TaxID=3425128 RepID=UPI00403CBEF9